MLLTYSIFISCFFIWSYCDYVINGATLLEFVVAAVQIKSHPQTNHATAEGPVALYVSVARCYLAWIFTVIKGHILVIWRENSRQVKWSVLVMPWKFTPIAGRSVAMWWIRTVEATGSRHSKTIFYFIFAFWTILWQRLAIRFHNSFALIPFYMSGTMTNVITVHSELRCLMRASSCCPIGRHRFALCCREHLVKLSSRQITK